MAAQPIDLQKHRERGGLDIVKVEPVRMSALREQSGADLAMERTNPLAGAEVGLDEHVDAEDTVVSLELFRERRSLEEQRDGLLAALQNMGEDEVVREELSKVEALLVDNAQRQEDFGRNAEVARSDDGSQELGVNAEAGEQEELSRPALPPQFEAGQQQVEMPKSVDPAVVKERELNKVATEATSLTPEEYEAMNREREQKLRGLGELPSEQAALEKKVGHSHGAVDEGSQTGEVLVVAHEELSEHDDHSHGMSFRRIVRSLNPFAKAQDSSEFAQQVEAKRKHQKETVE